MRRAAMALLWAKRTGSFLVAPGGDSFRFRCGGRTGNRAVPRLAPTAGFQRRERIARSELRRPTPTRAHSRARSARSEEHTSELQSLTNLVCRLLPEKKNQ